MCDFCFEQAECIRLDDIEEYQDNDLMLFICKECEEFMTTTNKETEMEAA
jgi:hypothetical protein